MELHNPWISIWTKPRATIARITGENPDRSIWWLAAIYGFCSLMNLFQTIALGNSIRIGAILIFGVVLSPFYGYVSFSVWSWFVFRIGKWFGGRGAFKAIRCAYAWSCVPLLLNIPLWLLMVLLFGNQLFLNFPEGHLLPTSEVSLLFLILIAKVVLAVWSFVIYLNGLAEVQGFSMVRAILNLIVAGVAATVIFSILWALLIYAAGGVAMNPFLLWKPF